MPELYDHKAELIRQSFFENRVKTLGWRVATFISSLSLVSSITQFHVTNEQSQFYRLASLGSLLVFGACAMKWMYAEADGDDIIKNNPDTFDYKLLAEDVDVPLEVIEREEQEIRDRYMPRPEDNP